MKHFFNIFLVLTFSFPVIAQIATSSSGARNIQPDQTGEEKVNQIITDSGNLFKEGLMNIQDNRRKQAREKFDKSVEVFLSSTINVPSNAKLKGCYDQLVETVYRLEFPTSRQQPQIRGLALTCGWNIDNGLADSVAKLTLSAPKVSTTTASNLTDKEKEQIQSITGNPSADIPQIGFSEQRYEASALDDLKQIDLTNEELFAVINGNTTRTCPSPSLQNITPGTTVAQAERILGRKLLFKPDVRNPVVIVAVFKSQGTRFVAVRAYQNIIYDVSVAYDNSIQWNGLKEFTNIVAKNLKILMPWRFSDFGANINCSNFNLLATHVGTSYFLNASDVKTSAKIKYDAELRKQQIQIENRKKKEAFKP